MGKCETCHQDKDLSTDEYVAERCDAFRSAYALLRSEDFTWEDTPGPMDTLAVSEYLLGDTRPNE